MMIFYTGFLLCLLWSSCESYRTFQQSIPNGDRVPHPCEEGKMWEGVGHENRGGGGPRNPFGQHFNDNGNTWSYSLCVMDSDGDGRTNGEELGDPGCTWSPGQTPSNSDSISHPGICDPVTSEACQQRNSFLQCDAPDPVEECRVLKEPATKSVDLRFPKTEVPDTETNYFCMTFDLPADQEYHVRAIEPIKDNMDVLHHILVFGCQDADKPPSTEPASCGDMDSTRCFTVLAAWAVGGTIKCYDELIGFRIGGNDTTRVKVEIHWNNPMKVKGYHDSSGMRFYYQPARPEVQDLLTFMTGQRLLEIPPGEPSVEHTSTCPSSCTWSLFSKPAYLVHSFNHMHYLGKSMKIELFRNGKLIKELTNDRRYDYDSPTDFTQKPHLEVRPGDEIKTTCVYNSVGIDRWVYYGDATSDEMCFGFLTMYPADALPYGGYCVGMGPLVGCDLYMGTRIGECNWRRFLDFSNDDMAPLIAELKKNCNLDGFCRPECKDITRRIKQHPCLQGEAKMLVTHFLSESHDGAKILGRLHSCSPDELKGHDDDDDRVDCSRQCSHMCDGGKGDNPWDNPRPNAGAGSLPAAMLVAFACFVAVGLIKH